MLARHDFQLLAELRNTAAPKPLVASDHDNVPHDDVDVKVHDNHGFPGTPDHTDGMVVDPVRHKDVPHTDVDRGVAVADPRLAPAAGLNSAIVDQVVAYRLDEVLQRFETILLTREQQIHRDIGRRVDALLSEVTEAFADLGRRTAEVERLVAELDLLKCSA